MGSEVEKQNIETWAILELMGHAQTAGIIRTGELGGLIRVDVPLEDGYRTEYYGEGAIYSIKIVSEEIARAYALPQRQIAVYNEPIVPRAEYENALQMSRNEICNLRRHIDVLESRLTAVNSLPAGQQGDAETLNNTDSDDYMEGEIE